MVVDVNRWKIARRSIVLQSIIPIFLLFLASCLPDKGGVKPTQQTLFTLLTPAESGVSFRNDILEDSIYNALAYTNSMLGGGVAAGDLNNDGLADLVFTSNQKGVAIYLNRGKMRFEGITVKSGAQLSDGWTTGLTLADINADGWLDIYVCRSGASAGKQRENQLFINQRDGTFINQTEKFGLNDGSPSTHAQFFDFDNDGDLDCYILNHNDDFNYILHAPAYFDNLTLILGKDRMMENIDGCFADVTEKAGLADTRGYGLSVSLCDVNNDGFTDLFIANDFIFNDQLFINNGNKTFSEQTRKYFAQTSLFSMGSDFGDINNDDRMDLLVVDMKPDNHQRLKSNFFSFPDEFYYSLLAKFSPPQFIKNVMQVANDTGGFSDLCQLCGLDKTDWSWSALIQDFDNDGWNDVHITNGTKRDASSQDFFLLEQTLMQKNYAHDLKNLYKQMPITLLRDYAFQNKGGLSFRDVSGEWGLNAASISNGAAYADFDGDGDLDLAVNNTDSVAFIFRNNSESLTSNHFLRLRLTGSGKNTYELGAKAKIYFEGKIQAKELQNGRGFQSSSEPVIHFGLGNATVIDSLEIFWQDGKYSLLKNLKADQLLAVSKEESSGTFQPGMKKGKSGTLLAQIKIQGLDFQHRESAFIDFKRERLLPYQLSKEGPGIATGDVNGDGWDDLFFTNGAGASPKLFLQRKDGSFHLSANQPWQNDTIAEGSGALFFDADNDGDNDLYMATGSNEFAEDAPALADRFYLNDGKGNFGNADQNIPAALASNSCVITADFDMDGDEDLFIGGRLIPGKFPLAGKSSLLRNDKGSFTDVTNQMAPGLENIGMVNSALFTDFDNDGKIDLVVCGDWMPVSFFRNTGSVFENITEQSSTGTLAGLWKSLAAGDFDNDGDMDYLAGNLGWNSFLKATDTEPLEILYNDFDDNGVEEPLLFHYLKHKRAPFADRNVFIEQMPKYKNIFLTYTSYAEHDWTLFFDEHKEKSGYFSVSTLSSGIFMNEGNGKFSFRALLTEAQISPVFGTCVVDFNLDGNVDILLHGNWFSNYYSSGQFDAGRGLLLTGDGTGNFAPASYGQSGFYNPDDGKSLTLFVSASNRYVFAAASNSSDAKCFSSKSAGGSRILKLLKQENSALLLFNDGRKQRVEPANICGYLSQPSNVLIIPGDLKSIQIQGMNGIRNVTF